MEGTGGGVISTTGSIEDPCPWNHINCSTLGEHYVPLDTGIAPSYVAIVSCTFSCLGSILIVLTFLLLKDMRTGSQKIITLLAIADLISAVGYIFGSINYLHNRHSSDCRNFDKLCTAQATITSWSSLVSFCWTDILAFYFFLIIVFKRTQVASRLMLVYNLIAWGAPLAIVIPLLALHKLGYAHFAASNWCYVKGKTTTAPSSDTDLMVLVAGKFWEIISYVLVSVLYVIIAIAIGKTRRQIKNTAMEPRVIHVETRLLAIPIIFILLRMWGTIQFLFSLGVKVYGNGCVIKPVLTTYYVLGILQAIGDGGQGWGNAILYIFLSPVIRERLMEEWFGKCIEKMEDDHLVNRAERRPTTDNSGIQTVQFRKGSKVRNGDAQGNHHDEADGSDPGAAERVPLVRNGDKATGYDIKNYDSTSYNTGTVSEASSAY